MSVGSGSAALKADVTFGVVTNASMDFERKDVDGILGLAYSPLACTPTCVMPAFDALRAANPGMRDGFAVCMNPAGGALALGVLDAGSFSGHGSEAELEWVPMLRTIPKSFYSIALPGVVQVDGVPLPLPNFRTAIVDSGTTLTVLSRDTYDALLAYLRAHFCHVPGLCQEKSWFSPANCVRMNAEALSKLPTLRVALEGGFELELTSTDYMVRYDAEGDDVWCVGISVLDDLGGTGSDIDVILGNNVMLKYVTVYDRENERVGFAPSDTECGVQVVESRGVEGNEEPASSPSAVEAA